MPTPLDARNARPLDGGASFTAGNRAFRAFWMVSWAVLASWTPPPFHGWRRLVLRAFGARVGRNARLHGSTRVWYPPNLVMGEGALLGPRVNCYNQGRIEIGLYAVVSQGAHLCASSHDIADPDFQLILKPITIGARAWIAAEAFIGPGCAVAEGCVVAARAVLFGETEPWGVYAGNPATLLKMRELRAPR